MYGLLSDSTKYKNKKNDATSTSKSNLQQNVPHPNQSILHPSSFHCIEFKLPAKAGSVKGLKKGSLPGKDTIQLYKNKFEYVCTDEKSNKKTVTITAAQLFNLIKTYSNTAQFGVDPNDWYSKFKQMETTDKQIGPNSYQNSKLSVGGTNFWRSGGWGVISPVTKKGEGLNYIFHPADSLASYPELSDEIYGDTRSGFEQAKLMRDYIKGGVSVSTWSGLDTSNVGKSPRTKDDTLKQITAALYGSETTRSPRTFISGMMLLDNMQNELINQDSAKFNASELIQKAPIRDKVGDKVVIKYMNANTNKLNFPLKPSDTSPVINSTKTSYEINIKQKAFLGGLHPMAGAKTLTLGKCDTYDSKNLVHIKEVGIFVDWLESHILKNDATIKNELDLMNKIKALLAMRTHTYDLMTNGKNANDLLKEYENNCKDSKAALDTARQQLTLALTQLHIPPEHQNDAGIKKYFSQSATLSKEIEKSEDNIDHNRRKMYFRELRLAYNRKLHNKIYIKCLQMISKKNVIGSEQYFSTIDTLDDFLKLVRKSPTIRFFEKEYLKVYIPVPDPNAPEFEYKLLTKSDYLKELETLPKNDWKQSYKAETFSTNNVFQEEVRKKTDELILHPHTFNCPHPRLKHYLDGIIMEKYLNPSMEKHKDKLTKQEEDLKPSEYTLQSRKDTLVNVNNNKPLYDAYLKAKDNFQKAKETYDNLAKHLGKPMYK